MCRRSGADRRRRAGARPPRLDHRHAPARQHKTFTPHYRLRRQHHRRQCRKVRLTGRKGRARVLLLAYRSSLAASRARPSASASKAASRARHRQGGRADDHPWSAGSRPDEEPACVRGPNHEHEAQQPEKLDVAAPEPQEFEDRLIWLPELSSFAELKKAPIATTTTPAAVREREGTGGPRLRHRPTQERRRPRLGEARHRKDHH